MLVYMRTKLKMPRKMRIREKTENTNFHLQGRPAIFIGSKITLLPFALQNAFRENIYILISLINIFCYFV